LKHQKLTSLLEEEKGKEDLYHRKGKEKTNLKRINQNKGTPIKKRKKKEKNDGEELAAP